jgi:hypothetical protein
MDAQEYSGLFWSMLVIGIIGVIDFIAVAGSAGG